MDRKSHVGLCEDHAYMKAEETGKYLLLKREASSGDDFEANKETAY